MRIGLAAAVVMTLSATHPLLAKDLPVRRSEPPRKATGCESLGPGYEKLPGTDTCVKVGGSVRAEGSYGSR